MARCGCGSGGCACTLVAGANAHITGTGRAVDPYVISASAPPSPCSQVRPCLSAGPGAAYDPATGVVSARLSAAAGNNIATGPDGGLFVPPVAGVAVATGCGLHGDGAANSPLTVRTGAWPYPCSVDSTAGLVYCDSTGVLRTDPPSRATRLAEQETTAYPNVTVPAAEDSPVVTRNLTITNPDPCREAFVLVETEVDVGFDLPPGGAAAAGIGTDDMVYHANNGATTIARIHTQVTKVVSRIVPPGGQLVEPLPVTVGRGQGKATYHRVQTWMQAWIFNL
ncbi:hypothetical protein [Streptomyces chrestomyceticus]|uniref:Uncharacterized protein n=1 Tax=Streptomyces chrestomyceticus TaxID=68185 RepID=A0ABU7X6V8_9ACTN